MTSRSGVRRTWILCGAYSSGAGCSWLAALTRRGHLGRSCECLRSCNPSQSPTMDRYGVGQNRDGESLLDVIQKGTGVNESQLQALDLLWVEQTVEGRRAAYVHVMLSTDCVPRCPFCHATVIQSDQPKHAESVASRVIAGQCFSTLWWRTGLRWTLQHCDVTRREQSPMLRPQRPRVLPARHVVLLRFKAPKRSTLTSWNGMCRHHQPCPTLESQLHSRQHVHLTRLTNIALAKTPVSPCPAYHRSSHSILELFTMMTT